MLVADVVVAGGGVSGLLIASALARDCSVILLEQCDSLPKNKYWLTDEKSATGNPQFQDCIDRKYSSLDFIAYDGLTASVKGSYCLWDTKRLVCRLEKDLLAYGAKILTGHRLYSISHNSDSIKIRANSDLITSRLLVDCMGFASPLVGANDVARITGYYILHGCEVALRQDITPIGLDNIIIDRRPAYFELFPTSRSTAHVSIILPSRHHSPGRSLKGDLNFILGKSHYSNYVVWPSIAPMTSYFGIIPVGRMHRPALDRIVFFGEAGQANPATSATALTRMLYTYRDLADGVLECLRRDTLSAKHLIRAVPSYMSPMNRRLQEDVFEKLLSFNSNDFRKLVQDLRSYPNDAVNDLMFANFNFRTAAAFRLFLQAFLRSGGVLRKTFIKLFFSYGWLGR